MDDNNNRRKALNVHFNHFCLIRNLVCASFDKAIKEKKSKFTIVKTYITVENVNSSMKMKIDIRKIENHLSNFVLYDIEFFLTNGAVSYCVKFLKIE